ncbi:MAG TPA: serine hydrolase domain-containing protein [Sphingomicrobium sp.]|nr:serine hydrolase domain-containing protein [Sphingomicrobium sp.]
MTLSRRAFHLGALSIAASTALASRGFAQSPRALDAAIGAIRAYGDAHLRHFSLPGMTLGLTAPGGFATVLDFGFADMASRRPVRPDSLFQIGSITKLMTAALIHQLAGEGRLRLGDRVSDLIAGVPLPTGSAITVQQLIDHVAGLPSDAPLFPAGGLWTAYEPGRQWHYSNTGYEILGLIAQRAGGKPFAQLIEERILRPLGMDRSRGAIIAEDRLLYAQGYAPADGSSYFARGAALAPAAWIDETSGAGSVGSTAEDMILLLRSIADAAQGRGGLGLPPEAAKVFTTHAVQTDTPAMRYGNGLMHVAEGGRSYLHHTGGMVGFSSSFHVDVASGAGAFASANIGFGAEYRPRLLTRFAVDVLTAALAGRPLQPPPPLAVALANAQAYVGRYAGPAGSFEVRAGSPLTIIADGQAAELQPWGGELFRTLHPRFRRFSLLFERSGAAVTRAHWGPSTFVRQGTASSPLAPRNAELARLAGRYVNDNPWLGTSWVVERSGRLWLGTEVPLTPLGGGLWRIGEKAWSPERGSFANFIDGRPQTFLFSGQTFQRRDV